MSSTVVEHMVSGSKFLMLGLHMSRLSHAALAVAATFAFSGLTGPVVPEAHGQEPMPKKASMDPLEKAVDGKPLAVWINDLKAATGQGSIDLRAKLVKAGGKGIAQPLAEALIAAGTSGENRLTIVYVLKGLGADAADALPTLQRGLAAKDKETVLPVATAIMYCGPKGVEVFTQGLSSKDALVRENAAFSLLLFSKIPDAIPEAAEVRLGAYTRLAPAAARRLSKETDPGTLVDLYSGLVPLAPWTGDAKAHLTTTSKAPGPLGGFAKDILAGMNPAGDDAKAHAEQVTALSKHMLARGKGRSASDAITALAKTSPEKVDQDTLDAVSALLNGKEYEEMTTALAAFAKTQVAAKDKKGDADLEAADEKARVLKNEAVRSWIEKSSTLRDLLRDDPKAPSDNKPSRSTQIIVAAAITRKIDENREMSTGKVPTQRMDPVGWGKLQGGRSTDHSLLQLEKVALQAAGLPASKRGPLPTKDDKKD